MGALSALVKNERRGQLNIETFDTMENLENMSLTIINYYSQSAFNRLSHKHFISQLHILCIP